jgi:hypothetical protein
LVIQIIKFNNNINLKENILFFKLFKNVAERGKWGGYLMHAYNSYKENQFEESFVLYSFLAEMGYEVAQSNTGFILDRGELNLLYIIFFLYIIV